ncbi:MAG: ankyrin repeat domain-containing protein, partial [Gammaproteobacteria bacterium]
TNEEARHAIAGLIKQGAIPTALSMFYGYLRFHRFNNPQDQLALLEIIQNNLHVFLRKDAVTLAGRDILNLLAMCSQQDQKAASIMLTLLNNFKPLKDNINRQNATGSTALHTACRYGTPEVATVLISKGASNNIENNSKRKADAYIVLKKHTEIVRAGLTKAFKTEIPNLKTVEPMPNLFNDTKDNGTAIMGALFRLVEITDYASAEKIIIQFHKSKFYSDKNIILAGYIDAHPDAPALWQKIVTNAKLPEAVAAINSLLKPHSAVESASSAKSIVYYQ